MIINYRFPFNLHFSGGQRKNLYQNKTLRHIFIPLLKKVNPGKIYIRHHYTRAKFALDMFMHKGYWYHGKAREARTMKLFKTLINQGFTILEVGGHIGYISNYFSSLVADKGKVYVFEPGVNNLPYLKENIKVLRNVSLVEKAVSDSIGTANFFIESLSGQNNSLLSDYGTTSTVHKFAFIKRKEELIQVETITLDSFCKQTSVVPDFIKIDIEGAELLALKGMHHVLQKHRPMMMIEITENWSSVFSLLDNFGYKLYNDNLKELNKENIHRGNTFCLHAQKHHQLIKDVFH